MNTNFDSEDLDAPRATSLEVQMARVWAARNPNMSQDAQRAYAEGMYRGKAEAMESKTLPDIKTLAAEQKGPLDIGLAISVLTRLLPGSNWHASQTISKGSILVVIEVPIAMAFDQQVLVQDLKVVTEQCTALRQKNREEQLRNGGY